MVPRLLGRVMTEDSPNSWSNEREEVRSRYGEGVRATCSRRDPIRPTSAKGEWGSTKFRLTG